MDPETSWWRRNDGNAMMRPFPLCSFVLDPCGPPQSNHELGQTGWLPGGILASPTSWPNRVVSRPTFLQNRVASRPGPLPGQSGWLPLPGGILDQPTSRLNTLASRRNPGTPTSRPNTMPFRPTSRPNRVAHFPMEGVLLSRIEGTTVVKGAKIELHSSFK
jgi:hypothetical protein